MDVIAQSYLTVTAIITVNYKILNRFLLILIEIETGKERLIRLLPHFQVLEMKYDTDIIYVDFCLFMQLQF